MQRKKYILILIGIISILAIPFIAMQFTKEVNWTLGDFLLGGMIIFSAGILIDYLLRSIKTPKYKVIAVVILLLFFILIWTELAVGVLPF